MKVLIVGSGGREHAIATCVGKPNISPVKSLFTEYHLIAAPANISTVLISPVNRTPILSRMIPPKKSIRRNTLI